MSLVRGPDVGQLNVQEGAFSVESRRSPRETLATQIAKSVLNAIRTGKIAVGARLPNESKLAEMFEVSRNTLREAVQLLIAQGVLESRKGIGTFVRSAGFSTWPVETGIEELASTTEIITSTGHVPGCSSYMFDVVPARGDVTKALLLDKGADVYRLSRIRLADDNPVILCVDYLPADLIPLALMKTFDGQGSLFSFLSSGRGLSISVARAVLKPIVPDPDVAESLGVAPDEPLLLLKQTHFDGQNQPFLYSENYVNSSLFEYHVRRMPRSFFASHPAHRLGPTEGME